MNGDRIARFSRAAARDRIGAWGEAIYIDGDMRMAAIGDLSDGAPLVEGGLGRESAMTLTLLPWAADMPRDLPGKRIYARSRWWEVITTREEASQWILICVSAAERSGGG